MRFAAGEAIHLGARLGLHLVREEPVARLLGARARDERDLGVAVEEHLLEVVRELEIFEGLGLARERRIPAGLAHRLARAHEALEARVVAQEVRVHVHDELVRQPLRALVRHLGRRGLGPARAEDRSIDVVHGDERRRHARRRLEEAPAAHPLVPGERAPSSLTRTSTCFCRAVWGSGVNSSLETNWVGMGEANAAVSAGKSCARSSGSSRLIAVSSSLGWRDRASLWSRARGPVKPNLSSAILRGMSVHGFTVYDMIARGASVHGEAPAIIQGERQISFRELKRRVDALAGGLAGLGIGKGERICILAQNDAAYLDLYGACARQGIIAYPINWRLTGEEVERVLERAAPAMMAIDASALGVAAGWPSSKRSVAHWYQLGDTAAAGFTPLAALYGEAAGPARRRRGTR